MDAWYFLITPLAVLAVFALFRFVGCHLVFGLERVEQDVDYPTAVGKTHDAANNSLLVSYWRLQELLETDPAVDEKGINPGTYVRPTQNLTTVPAELSPAGATEVAERLKLGQPGLLDTPNPPNTALEVHGGSVEIPFSGSLNLDSFSVEALVMPTWENLISTARPGRLRSVVEFGGPLPKTSGFALYAGPSDPANPATGLYKWQVWMGDGTTFKPVAIGSDILFNQLNYLALTYDAPTRELRLFVYYTGIDVDLVKQTSADVGYAIHATTVPLTIGAGRSAFSNTTRPLYFFQGRIQEVAYYRQALTEEQVLSHIASMHQDL